LQIGLLDFGATREYKPSFVNTYFRIIDAAAHKDRDSVLKYSRDIGFLTGYESKVRERLIESSTCLPKGCAQGSRQRAHKYSRDIGFLTGY
jgi:aarF domain-containing kinase